MIDVAVNNYLCAIFTLSRSHLVHVAGSERSLRFRSDAEQSRHFRFVLLFIMGIEMFDNIVRGFIHNKTVRLLLC